LKLTKKETPNKNHGLPRREVTGNGGGDKEGEMRSSRKLGPLLRAYSFEGGEEERSITRQGQGLKGVSSARETGNHDSRRAADRSGFFRIEATHLGPYQKRHMSPSHVRWGGGYIKEREAVYKKAESQR